MSRIVLKREGDETWLQTAIRQAARHGLQREVQSSYDQWHTQGAETWQAALWACMDWDVADWEEEP